jgi:hypothetical protein
MGKTYRKSEDDDEVIVEDVKDTIAAVTALAMAAAIP